MRSAPTNEKTTEKVKSTTLIKNEVDKPKQNKGNTIYHINLNLQTFVNIDTDVSNCNLTFLIDTGADISVIKSKKLYAQTLYWSDSSVKISGITNGIISSIGKSTINFFANTENRLSHEVHIVDSSFPIPTDGILGIDFLLKYACVLNFDTFEMTVKSHNSTFSVPICNSFQGKLFLPRRCETIHKMNLNIHEDTVITAKEIKPGIFVAGSVISPHKQYIRLLNTTNETAEVELKLDMQPLTDFEILPRPTVTDHTANIFNLNSSKTHDTARDQRLRELISVPTHIKADTRKKFDELCNDYTDIFHLEGDRLSTNNFYEQGLHLKDREPVYVKNYRTPHHNKTEIAAQV